MVRSSAPGARFESLRKEAKRILRELRAGGSVALARFPGLGPDARLREVQHALAREHNFPSWAALKEDCEVRDLAAQTPDELVTELLRSGCLDYGGGDGPDKWRRAERIRARHPLVARANIFAACATGELELALRLLAEDPARASSPGGPQNWPPLLFVCYSRIPHPAAGENSVAIARALLDRGADPGASFLSDGTYRFTALTGAIGKGEMWQPPHPRARELAQLLLERGADPNDGQGLYNDMLVGDDDSWLRLLLAHGLGASDEINWKTDHPMRVLDYLLGHAVRHGHRRRAVCLLEHGADPNAPDFYNRRSPRENALLAGQLDLAELLVRHGAARTELAGHDAFVAACARLDPAAARTLADRHPEYLGHSDPLIDAAEAGRVDQVRLLLDLGMDPDRAGWHGKRPLHAAAGAGSREVVELLLERGADPMARAYGGTAAGWARHGRHPELARRIAERTRSPHDAARTGHVELLAEILAEDPAAARRVDDRGDTPLHLLPDDLDRGGAVVDLLLRHGADPAAKDRDGKTPAELADARGFDELADLMM